MNTLAFVRLDALSMRPYATALVAASLLGAGISTLSRSTQPTAVLAITIAIVTMLASSYLFSLAERSGLDTLYALARIGRAQVVRGRYATLLLAAMAGTALGILAYITVTLARGLDPLTGLPEAALAAFDAMVWLIAVQCPVCFRWGYTKARFALLILVFVVAIGAMAVGSLLQFGVSAQQMNPAAGLAVFTVVTLAALAGSMALSTRWYSRREL